MIDDNKITIMLSKLNSETKENKLKWNEHFKGKFPNLSSAEELVGKIYETTFNNKILWLFKINQRYQTDEFEYTWMPSYKLIILDSNYDIDWEFPSHRGIMDLFETVSYKVADMDSFFASIKDEDILVID